MTVQAVPISEITLDPENKRRHDEKNLAAIRRSLERFGQQSPIVLDSSGRCLKGNGTILAAQALGWKEIQAVHSDLEGRDADAYAVADNRAGELATWEQQQLAQFLEDQRNLGDLECTGFQEEDLDALIADLGNEVLGDDFEVEAAPEPEPEVPEVEVPEAPEEAKTKPGDLYLLGDHRLLCGDSTNPAHVARLFGDVTASLIHADPPYGRGKEKEGVANADLYRDKLDAFQMQWWQAWRPRLEDNASAYVWGNAPDLWRLWYVGGLSEFERMTVRNEITWDKRGGYGVGTEGLRSYFPTERCLFFMLGEQGFNTNADNYWEGWEPIRSYLVGEMERCGWTAADVNRITGTQMAGHWFTRSQWAFITEDHYHKIQKAAQEHGAFKREHGAFKREHDELKREHDELKREHDELKAAFYETRAHFDNTHDNMTDVWAFPRVTGEDRHGHATPKPVQMVARAIKSSTRKGEAVAVPFGGTGPELIAADHLGRQYLGMELEPRYCDVIVQRWEELTGGKAKLAEG